MDTAKVDDETFEIVVKYLATMKGGSRKATRKAAKNIKKRYKEQQGKGEEETGAGGEEVEKIGETMYQRAKKVAKILKG